MIGNYYNPNQYRLSTKSNTDPYSSQYDGFSPQYQQAQQTIHTGALNQLKNDYNQTIQSNVNNLNRRGLFGSSIASEDIGKTNYAYAQAEATLAAQEAQQQQQNFIEQQRLEQQQAQFQQNLEFQKQQQKFQQQQARQNPYDEGSAAWRSFELYGRYH